jgi:hypothetical protein
MEEAYSPALCQHPSRKTRSGARVAIKGTLRLNGQRFKSGPDKFFEDMVIGKKDCA